MLELAVLLILQHGSRKDSGRRVVMKSVRNPFFWISLQEIPYISAAHWVVAVRGVLASFELSASLAHEDGCDCSELPPKCL